MNKLIACALLGLGLTQVLAACSSDSSSPTSETGGSGGKGGSSGASTGGKAAGGDMGAEAGSPEGGRSTGGKGGTGSGATGGTGVAGKGGTGGTDTATGGEPAEGGVGGVDLSAAGAGGAPVEPPPPPPEPKVADLLWLNEYCLARSSDGPGPDSEKCTGALTWDQCYNQYAAFIHQDALCNNDDADYTKSQALLNAFNDIATACPSPDATQIRCNLAGGPEFRDETCRDADSAMLTISTTCDLSPP